MDSKSQDDQLMGRPPNFAIFCNIIIKNYIPTIFISDLRSSVAVWKPTLGKIFVHRAEPARATK